ncbi:Uncharacterised protein [Mycobacteroides abscessus subsp. abscessus]|nr:Uncharacterised protein [Mycobacteroides abscessus subsp. abscessus]
MEERARPEPVGGFFERAVGRGSDDAVDQQAPALLKRPHGVVQCRVKAIDHDVPTGRQDLVGVLQEPEGCQHLAHLGDGRASIAVANVRRACRHTPPFAAFRSRI